MAERTKLELTWVGKEINLEIEPRILIETKELSYQTTNPSFSHDQAADLNHNMLIHGDNLLALKALEQEFTGRVKCVYIDPPYNTGSAFEQYDDNLEHSKWLSLIKPRLVLLRKLLRDDGSIWISIDDDERDYLKLLCDEIFGRTNFIASCIWEKKATRSNDARWFSDNHDYILVYAKNKDIWRPNLLPRNEDSKSIYTNVDNDPRGIWASGPCHAKTPNEKDIYPLTTPSGKQIMPPPGTSWRFSESKFKALIDDNRIYFGPNGDNVPRYKRFLTEVQDGFVPLTIWPRDEVGDNQEAKKEVKMFNPTDVFSTPKPERLVERILTLGSNPGDLVLDSFLGSGTTTAVAHKMGRTWIGIEMGNHAYSHCKTRMDAVITGEQGGVSKTNSWTGGGSYKFYELAASLINFDEYGQPIINHEYNPDMLAAAVSLHEGYKYSPRNDCYWKQATNGNNSFLFVTTRHISIEYARTISFQLLEGEFLLIVCRSFDEAINLTMKNIRVKKVPQSLLSSCEFGVENYNLHIVNPPVYEDEADD